MRRGNSPIVLILSDHADGNDYGPTYLEEMLDEESYSLFSFNVQDMIHLRRMEVNHDNEALFAEGFYWRSFRLCLEYIRDNYAHNNLGE